MSYYDDLGLARSATEGEIRDRYRELAMLLHPDRGGDAAMFRCLNEAYEVLSDAGARRAYDATLGPMAPAGNPSRPGIDRAQMVDEIPAWARDRWIVEEFDVVPDTRYHRWRQRSIRIEPIRRQRARWFLVGAAAGAGIGALVGPFTSEPVLVATILTGVSGLVGEAAFSFSRTGRAGSRR